MSVIWLLDVDGVLNCDKPNWHEGRRAAWAYSQAIRYKMVWSDAVMARVRKLTTHPNLTILWSTTWVDDIAQLERLFRLPNLGLAFSGLGDNLYTGDLKLAAAYKVLDDGDDLIWTDDTEVPKPEWQTYTDLMARPGGRRLLIRPDEKKGLQLTDLDVIEEFVNERHL